MNSKAHVTPVSIVLSGIGLILIISSRYVDNTLLLFAGIGVLAFMFIVHKLIGM